MAKVRIHELAKELKMENKDLLKLLEKMEIPAKNVHSTIEEADVERVKTQVSLSRKEGIVEQRVKPTVIRRRVHREEVVTTTAPEAKKEETKPTPPPPPPLKKPAVPEVIKPEVIKKEPEVVPKVVAKVEKIEKKEEKKEILFPPPSFPETGPPLTLSEVTPTTPVVEEGLAQTEIKEVLKEARPEPEPLAREKFIEVKEVVTPPALAGEPAVPLSTEAKTMEKTKVVEKPPAKIKKKAEPAKIIERPAVPPLSLVPETPGVEKKVAIPFPPKVTAQAPKPPIILQPPVSVPQQVLEEERIRRKKKFKRDVEVMEEGKPNRIRIITTKKRAFREFDYYQEDQGVDFVPFEREARVKSVRPKIAKPEITIPKPIKRKIRISEAILVGELAKRMGIKASEVIKKLLDLGLMVTINQAIDVDAAALVASDFGYEVEKTGLELEDLVEEREDQPEELIPRPPVVTIMGHVDHGKTSLLDAIRQTNVTAAEAGGITQHIGAYEVEVDHRKVVFLDTPGHEAFTAMRARGAKVTDIVVLIVAADDGVMTQTVEAINHAKAANVPIIVAINKIDKPNANPERVKQALTEYNLVPEAWGGQTIFAEISAKLKIGLQNLLEMILLQADLMDLKANPHRPAGGVIIEAKLDRGRGPVATVLVQNGTLHVGDPFVSGIHFGRVRAMINDRGEKIEQAGPSTPVEVIGFPSVPNAGDSFVVVKDERRAKELATQRMQKQRELELSKTSKITLEDFYKKMKKGVVKDLNLILKGDVQGSLEALIEALNRLSTDSVKINIIHSSVGSISESDCMLASASQAIILGFNVKIEPKAQAVAEQERIDIRVYNIIYEAIEDVHKAMEGLLEPVYQERLIGRAEVRALFNISRVGMVAGCFVLEGRIVRGAHAHVMRNGQVIHEGNITSLKHLKDDVKEIASGYECGLAIGDFRGYALNDIIEAYVVQKISAEL
ncbi:MAG: translation initiation factor IF-2 [Thermodesulfobacteriota bacterium]